MSDDDVAGIGRDPDLLEAFYREHVEAVQRFVREVVLDPGDHRDETTVGIARAAVAPCEPEPLQLMP